MGFSIIINGMIAKVIKRNRDDCIMKHLLHNYLNNKMCLSLLPVYNPDMVLNITGFEISVENVVLSLEPIPILTQGTYLHRNGAFATQVPVSS